MALFGIALVALPTGILTAGFFRALKSQNDRSSQVKKDITREGDARLIALDILKED